MLDISKHILGFSIFAMLSCSGCADDVFLMSEIKIIHADGRESLFSSGCESASGDSASTGASFPTTTPNRDVFELHHEHHDGGIIVTVTSSDGDKLLAKRVYSEKFLEAGREDELTVQLPNDESLHLLYWGGPECGSPRPTKN